MPITPQQKALFNRLWERHLARDSSMTFADFVETNFGPNGILAVAQVLAAAELPYYQDERGQLDAIIAQLEAVIGGG